MSFWSGETLQRDGSKLVEPFEPNQIDCNAYVLRMGDHYYRTADKDGKGELQKTTLLKEKEAFVIPPGQFAFLITKEIVKVPPNAMAFISMSTTIKFQGLINISGFHVDPGYTGRLIYSVYNASPSSIQIKEGDRLFRIWFGSMDQTSAPPFIKGPDDGRFEITNDMVRGMSREIVSVQSLADKLAEQRPTIENLMFIWRTLTIAVVGGLLAAFLTFAIPTMWAIGHEVAAWVRSDWKGKQAPTSQQSPTSPPGSQRPPAGTTP